ncbi:G-type lectin S-receptor-like serine/threonine-protein kinase SD2-5 [Solanum tuberosum]|uniref:Receptor-like serine/threonine-protein kinase n=1 Tax=Solanum tuberosum TaxID=4113 RepID=M1BGA7_SOLTU|nr:PREDICTED: G-type lectin S-receptor-like serine/threonine-protein kinase SD2-5 [Solanum tuberosum]
MVLNYSAILFMASLLFISSQHLISCQPPETFITNSSISWINSRARSYVVNSTDGATLTPILSRERNETLFVCGFLCDYNGTACVFGVLLSPKISNNNSYLYYARLVWSANRNNPVRANATLQLRQDGGLFLMDSDGTLIWSTTTSTRGKVVTGFKLTVLGNIVLFDKSNDIIWQSFDHPTDTLVPGQMTNAGQMLRSSVSATNWSEGLFTFEVQLFGFLAYIKSNPRQLYVSRLGGDNGSPFPGLIFDSKIIIFNGTLILNFAFSNTRFMRFGNDGHLRVYHWRGSWLEEADLLTDYIGECGYPTVCGNYSVCANGQCTCPQTAVDQTNFLQQINYRQPNQGCVLITPISCEHSQYHILMELKYIAYIPLYLQYGTNKTDLENCKTSCLSNCSCKAAQFQFSGPNNTMGHCALLNDVFSLTYDYGAPNKTTLFIKVQSSFNLQASPSLVSSEKKSKRVSAIVGSTIGASFGLLLMVLTCFAYIFRRRKGLEEDEEEFLDQIPGMPTRFSYEELTVMTENFSEKLGEGGFGSVFEGTMSDGTKIAVKRLQGFDNVKKSFLAEVATIGSIQHVNLVKLVGFCAEKSHRLLVYEYMANGSLDRWIFHGKQERSLTWDIRKKIISDVAKGLAYLHEDCNNKIIHLDIKPQNILLDHNLNAKVSDFGLSKLVGKDESKIVTTMRGTPGYLAPEWLHEVITEKVDVYSFGVVILEIICGRKNLDRHQDEDDMHLLSLFMRKAEERQLLEMVDKNSEDMQLHRKEAVEMMKIAAWCLQSDYTKRPSMSLVVKVFQGLVAAETDLHYSFTFPTMTRRVAGTNQERESVVGISLPLPSQLSGPR